MVDSCQRGRWYRRSRWGQRGGSVEAAMLQLLDHVLGNSSDELRG